MYIKGNSKKTNRAKGTANNGHQNHTFIVCGKFCRLQLFSESDTYLISITYILLLCKVLHLNQYLQILKIMCLTWIGEKGTPDCCKHRSKTLFIMLLEQENSAEIDFPCNFYHFQKSNTLYRSKV